MMFTPPEKVAVSFVQIKKIIRRQLLSRIVYLMSVISTKLFQRQEGLVKVAVFTVNKNVPFNEEFVLST